MRRRAKIIHTEYPWFCRVCNIAHGEKSKGVHIKFVRRTKGRGPKDALICPNCATAIERTIRHEALIGEPVEN